MAADPCKTLFGCGGQTCSIARWTGTMARPAAPFSRRPASFELDFCTMARWRDG
jgi:hypothetical protein